MEQRELLLTSKTMIQLLHVFVWFWFLILVFLRQDSSLFSPSSPGISSVNQADTELTEFLPTSASLVLD